MRVKERLDIAIKALKRYANEDNWIPCGEYGHSYFDERDAELTDDKVAQKALKQIGEAE